MQTKHAALLAGCVALGLILAGGAGCTKTQAEPLQVTYYYLPG